MINPIIETMKNINKIRHLYKNLQKVIFNQTIPYLYKIKILYSNKIRLIRLNNNLKIK
jgi:hypothetical protein